MRNASRWLRRLEPQSVELIPTIRQPRPLREAAPGDSTEKDVLSLFLGSSPANLLCSPRHRRRKTSQKYPETPRSSWQFRRAGSPRSGLAPPPVSFYKPRPRTRKRDQIMFIDHRSSPSHRFVFGVWLLPPIESRLVSWSALKRLRTKALFQVPGLCVELAQAFIPPSTVRFAPVT